MTKLWPRLPHGPAAKLFSALQTEARPSWGLEHERAYFAPIGQPVTRTDLARVRSQVLHLAEARGFPEQVPEDALGEFDQDVTEVLWSEMPMTWAEAGSRELWSFIALVLLPDITHWRWNSRGKSFNRERWICTDMTRHTWGRLWWRHVQFGGDIGFIRRLGEANVNQFLERSATIGARPELIQSLCRHLEPHLGGQTVPLRDLVRDVTKRLLRQMAYIDEASLEPEDRDSWVADLVSESLVALGAGTIAEGGPKLAAGLSAWQTACFERAG